MRCESVVRGDPPRRPLWFHCFRTPVLGSAAIMHSSMVLRATLCAALAVALAGSSVFAADIALPGRRLVIVDRNGGTGKDKVVFAAWGRDLGITKGAGTDLGDISAALDVAYGDGATAGRFILPAGAFDGLAGWRNSKRLGTMFLNKSAPGGPTVVRRSRIKTDRVIKLVAEGAGDVLALDILGAGSPAGSVFTAYCIDNSGERNCYCSEFLGCGYHLRAKGNVATLRCWRHSIGDPTCRALQPTMLSASAVADVDFEACGGTP